MKITSYSWMRSLDMATEDVDWETDLVYAAQTMNFYIMAQTKEKSLSNYYVHGPCIKHRRLYNRTAVCVSVSHSIYYGFRLYVCLFLFLLSVDLSHCFRHTGTETQNELQNLTLIRRRFHALCRTVLNSSLLFKRAIQMCNKHTP